MRLYKTVLQFLFSIGLSCCWIDSLSASIQAIFKVQQNNSNQTFTANIILKNNTAQNFRHWKIAFNFNRAIVQAASGVIVQHIGGFYVIEFKNRIIAARGKIILRLVGKGSLIRKADMPNGYFLVTSQNKIIPIVNLNIIPPWKPSAIIKEGKSIATALTLQQSLIIPLPVKLHAADGNFILTGNAAVAVKCKSALTAARFFTDNINPATGYHLQVGTKESSPAIIFACANKNVQVAQEGYTLEVNKSHILLQAKTAAGFFYGVQSLRQLLPPAIFDKKRVKLTTWTIPRVSILDYPRFHYRGLLLDSARHFIPAVQVKRLIDLMAIYKLNVLQWHLTDDEGWRVQIQRYPQLTAIGAWRGFNLAIPPALGSGGMRYGGYYSQNEIRAIVQYAAERHITIIPEIDMPGHARAMIMSLRDQLFDRDDKSKYTSAQGFHDNVLSPCLPSTYKVIKNVLSEIAVLFPAKIVHVGSDEIPKNVWQSKRCHLFMTEHHLTNPSALQHYFLQKIEKILHAKNKQMAVWEEGISGGDLAKSTVVYYWKDERFATRAEKKGYPIILMPAKYLYFDLAYTDNPNEPGASWAGFIDTFKVYSYRPKLTRLVNGIQGALWSENINSQQRLDYLAFPRLLALAEIAWTPLNRLNWNNFSERVGLQLQKLKTYGVKYRSFP